MKDWPSDVAFIAEVMPDWTTLQLPSGQAFGFNRETGRVYRLPHPDCPFAIIGPPPEATRSGEGDEVVGHKTFSDGKGGFRHEPLTRAEADVLIAHCNSEDERRKALIPDEQSAIRLMMDAYIRLKEMGWNDAIYCPKDGRAFEVIEPGSTGIFKCVYQGEWPKGTWWIVEDGDMSPSRPVLFRSLAASRGEGGGALEGDK